MQLALPPVLRANGGGHRPNVAGRKPLRGIGADTYRQNRREQFGTVGLLIVDRISVLHPATRGKWRFLDADDRLLGQTVCVQPGSKRKGMAQAFRLAKDTTELLS